MRRGTCRSAQHRQHGVQLQHWAGRRQPADALQQPRPDTTLLRGPAL